MPQLGPTGAYETPVTTLQHSRPLELDSSVNMRNDHVHLQARGLH